MGASRRSDRHNIRQPIDNHVSVKEDSVNYFPLSLSQRAVGDFEIVTGIRTPLSINKKNFLTL